MKSNEMWKLKSRISATHWLLHSWTKSIFFFKISMTLLNPVLIELNCLFSHLWDMAMRLNSYQSVLIGLQIITSHGHHGVCANTEVCCSHPSIGSWILWHFSRVSSCFCNMFLSFFVHKLYDVEHLLNPLYRALVTLSAAMAEGTR